MTHAAAKVCYQLLYGKLIDAVYHGNREEVGQVIIWQLVAAMLAVWCDQYAGIFLSIGGARLSVRLQKQVSSHSSVVSQRRFYGSLLRWISGVQPHHGTGCSIL